MDRPTNEQFGLQFKQAGQSFFFGQAGALFAMLANSAALLSISM
jgi:hypothetical protein